MLSYLSWLVASKVFRKVHLGFLIVGYGPPPVVQTETVSGFGYTETVFFSPPIIANISLHVSRHTHNGDDQRFGCSSRRLRRVDAKTVPELAEVLVGSYTDPDTGAPILKTVEECIDWKAWFEPCKDKVSNVTQAHQYVFQLQVVNGREECVISCKQFAATPDEKTVNVGCLLKVCLRSGCLRSERSPKPFRVFLTIGYDRWLP
jgi:hypothetical protein